MSTRLCGLALLFCLGASHPSGMPFHQTTTKALTGVKQTSSTYRGTCRYRTGNIYHSEHGLLARGLKLLQRPSLTYKVICTQSWTDSTRRAAYGRHVSENNLEPFHSTAQTKRVHFHPLGAVALRRSRSELQVELLSFLSYPEHSFPCHLARTTGPPFKRPKFAASFTSASSRQHR